MTMVCCCEEKERLLLVSMTRKGGVVDKGSGT